jgi:hypothetical protein
MFAPFPAGTLFCRDVMNASDSNLWGNMNYQCLSWEHYSATANSQQRLPSTNIKRRQLNVLNQRSSAESAVGFR